MREIIGKIVFLTILLCVLISAVACAIVEDSPSIDISSYETILLSESSGIDYYRLDYGPAIPYTSSFTIKGTAPLGFTLLVQSGNHSVNFDSVRIDNSEKDYSCAFRLNKNTVIDLTLYGTNVLKSGRDFSGIQVPKGASLVITEDSTGILEAVGVQNGAGIGVGQHLDSGIVMINGGTVIARGAGSSGIGAGLYGKAGDVVINGGTVEATGLYGGMSIGDGTGSVKVNPTVGKKMVVKDSSSTDTAVGVYTVATEIASMVGNRNTIFISQQELTYFEGKVDLPKTGDDSILCFWILCFVVSLASMKKDKFFSSQNRKRV